MSPIPSRWSRRWRRRPTFRCRLLRQLAASPHMTAVAAAAGQAFSQATRLTAFTAAAFLAVGLLASLSLGRVDTPPHAEAAGAEPGQQPGAGRVVPR
jgi:hypothetical protein